jgi:hypothetical protein
MRQVSRRATTHLLLRGIHEVDVLRVEDHVLAVAEGDARAVGSQLLHLLSSLLFLQLFQRSMPPLPLVDVCVVPHRIQLVPFLLMEGRELLYRNELYNALPCG